MLPLIFLILFTNLFGQIRPLPNGAPLSSCSTLTPFHAGGIPAMRSPSPFRIIPTVATVGQGQTLRLEIESSPVDLPFGGFMLQARSTSPPYAIVGRFSPSSDNLFKLINCFGDENTATHVSTSPKKEVTLEWQAPTDFLGEIVFNGTVAQAYDKFWVGIESPTVEVVQRGAGPPFIGISTTRRPATTTVPTYVEEKEKRQPAVADSFYNDCGSSKSCFGFPDGCVSQKSCQAIVGVIVQGERYQFEMKSGYNSPAYVAVGLSNDNKMGGDSVIECVQENGAIKTYASWTTAAPYDAIRGSASHLRLLNSSFIDGVIYCKVERNAITTIEGTTFDLISNKYHLLLASGQKLKNSGSVDYHDIGRLASAQPQSLAVVSDFSGSSVLLLRLHGAFMLTAWIGTASIGILLARYFKQTWVGSQLCGKDQWFAWHRVFMVLTWLLTMAGFIIIFVEINGWSTAQNPHAILGVITTAICFFQPIGALFRPAPGSKNRPYFNWIHWLGGNLAHILAIVTIFFAVKLTKAELPEWLDWILVAFVAFHVFMHFIFSIAGCASDRRNVQRVTSFPMTDMTPSRGSMGSDRKQDAPYSGLRKILLTVYLVVIILFVVAVVVIAVLAPIEMTVDEIKSKIMN